jgi:Cu/Ag efflux protein CusF
MLTAALSITNLYAQAAEPAALPMHHATAAESKVAHGMGVVEAIDTKAGTVTLKHEAIPELNWPAMTMPFKVAGNAAANVSVGQKVMFELSAEGNAVTITKIEKAD